MTAGRRPGPPRRLTDADLVVLGMLSVEPVHGHGMWNRLSQCDIEDWAEVSRAQVYYSLGKLAEQGLIVAADESPADDQRERIVWRLTPDGKRALKKTLSSADWSTRRRVPPFLTWVGWSELVTPAARRTVVRQRRRFLEAEIARKRDALADVRRAPADTPAIRVTISMIEQVIRQLSLELDWLDELDSLFADA